MDFENLRTQWQTSGNVDADNRRLLEDIRQSSSRFERETRLRTLYGAASFLLPIPLVAFVFRITPAETTALKTVEGLMMAFLLLGAGMVIARGMKIRNDPARAMNLREFLQAQLDRVENQARLFRSMKWWFWTPLLAGWAAYCVVVLAGGIDRNLFSVLNLFLFPALAYFGIRAGARYVEREIQPWHEALAANLQTLNQAEEESVSARSSVSDSPAS